VTGVFCACAAALCVLRMRGCTVLSPPRTVLRLRWTAAQLGRWTWCGRGVDVDVGRGVGRGRGVDVVWTLDVVWSLDVV